MQKYAMLKIAAVQISIIFHSCFIGITEASDKSGASVFIYIWGRDPLPEAPVLPHTSMLKFIAEPYAQF